MSNDRDDLRTGRRANRLLLIVPLLVGLASAGCDGLLEVDNESDILDEDLNSPDAVEPIVNGVAGDFGVFYSEHSVAVGLAAFELWHTGSHGHDRETDEGFLDRPSSDGNDGYNDASRAYWVSQDAQRRLREIYNDADSRVEMAEVLVWGGFALTIFADNWCQATFDGGPVVSRDSVRSRAESDFTEAVEIADRVGADADEWRLRALAGRARVRLFRGDYTGALADAGEIGEGYEFLYDYSNNAAREYNYFAGHTRDKYRREVGVHPRFFEDDRYWDDPRTPMNDWGEDAVGPDAIRRWVEQNKYPERDSDMPISTWQEVRLIEAEAELFGNADPDRAAQLIDEVRASHGLDPYAGPRTHDAVLEQLRYERSAELWLQGQALADLRRFDDPLLDVAPDRGGGETRGECWEIGEDEFRSNPNLAGG